MRLIAHAVAPKSYGPAGGYDIFTNLVAGVMYVFGFIVAATLGCTAGSVDLSEGMFRHLVVTGRSRLSLYLARIPAGLAIVVPLVAIGFTIVCAVCCLAAPKTLNYDGVSVPAGLSRSGLESWAADHAGLVVCDFSYNGPGRCLPNVPCGPNGLVIGKPGSPTPSGQPSAAQIRAAAVLIAQQNYSSYATTFLSPSVSLMIKSGLWIELEAVIGFIVGLGLASLMGQRTVAVVLMIVLELDPDADLLDGQHSPPDQFPEGGGGPRHGPYRTRRAAPGLRGRRWWPGRPGGQPPRAGDDSRRRLRHPRLADRMDDPRGVADDDEGRLTDQV